MHSSYFLETLYSLNIFHIYGKIIDVHNDVLKLTCGPQSLLDELGFSVWPRKRAYLRVKDWALANSVGFNFPICDRRGIGLENLQGVFQLLNVSVLFFLAHIHYFHTYIIARNVMDFSCRTAFSTSLQTIQKQNTLSFLLLL